MRYLKTLIITLLIGLSSFVFGTEFGYITYTTFNIGDDFQALAAKRFLPGNPQKIDREFIGVFQHQTPLPTLVNGWFMHTKDFCWYRHDVPAPEKSWPPSPSINPLLISIHLAEGFIPYAFSNEAVEYLKAHAPIGARDLNTLQELESRNIPSYFSGCLCLTMENEYKARNDIIYAVDLDDECYNYLKSRTNYPVLRLTHIIDQEIAFNPEKRLAYTLAVLEKYKKAKAVVTVRLHGTMPCLAFETPVLIINERNDKRLHGLRELAHNCNREEFLNGQFDFDFNNPDQNPRQYLNLRENLINIVNNWVANHEILQHEVSLQ